MEQWRGVYKLQEEMAELSVILSKLCVFPNGKYPDGRDLIKELSDELSDVSAAFDYFVRENNVEPDVKRIASKLVKFNQWGLSGVDDGNL